MSNVVGRHKYLPKISIITPSLNQSKYIEEAILSVMNQAYDNYEHIIVDGGSTDDTLEILGRYSFRSDKLKWLSEPDQGQSDALNKGFRMATGDIVGWLNADDRYLPGCFYKVAEVFANNPDVDIVYGDYRFIDEQGKVFKLRKEIDFDLFILKYLHVLYIPSTATFFRRWVIDEGNFLRLDLHYAMDYEFFLRLALKGYRFLHVPEYLADFRWHPESKSSKAARAQRAEQENALMELDPLMSRLKQAPIRLPVRLFLLLMARTKRTWLKLLKGSYWAKWD